MFMIQISGQGECLLPFGTIKTIKIHGTLSNLSTISFTSIHGCPET